MKKFFGVLRYVKGYWRYAILNIVFNILSVIFSLFSILMLLPFLKILFSNDPNALQAIAAKEPVFSFSTSGLLDLLNHTLAKGAVDNGKVSVLIWICLFTVIMVFLKNLFRYLAMYFLAPIRNGVVRDMRNKIFNKSLELPLAYYSPMFKKLNGTLCNRSK